MASPIPKDPSTRRRRNIEHRRETVAEPAPAPALFGEWSELTRRWWDVWATCPQSVMFTTTDWQRLQTLLPIVERYWLAPSVPLMAEIRLNESLLGATVVDRMKLRWDLVSATADAEPTPGDDWRARLKVVDDAVAGS